MEHVLVTGASSGIGAATALALARPRTSLHLVARGEAKLKEVAAEALARGAAVASAYSVDVSDDGALESLAGALGSATDRLDALIHSAGVVSLGNVADADIGELDRQYRVNLRAPFRLTQLLLASIIRAKGTIVFVNSGAGLKANPSWSQYAATKHGLKALADSVRGELSEHGVRVVSVYPGRVDSPMQRLVHEFEQREYHPEAFLRPQDVATQIVTAVDLPRPAQIVDVSIRPGP